MCAGPDLIRIVDLMHRDKNIPKEVIFEGIEAALQLATQKHYGTEEEIAITIDRDSGEIKAQKGELVIDPAELGRIAAQSAKQVMIQKIREAECNAIFDEYAAMKGDLVHGTVQRFEGAPPLSPWASPRPSCRAASRSPARPTTSASASRR
jgi:transcription termination/antitermination protein NusA